MQIVPLTVMPSQKITVTLGAQPCVINVYQKRTGLYFDLYVSGEELLVGVLCLQANLLVRSLYLGFVGDLAFFDISGAGEDPNYSGVMSQFVLAYLSPAEVSSMQASAIALAVAAENAAEAGLLQSHLDFTIDFVSDFN